MATVTPIRIVWEIPVVVRQTRPVSEVQEELSHEVPPKRAFTLASNVPKPPPCTVTESPRVAILSDLWILMLGRSHEIASVTDPADSPDVRETRIVFPTLVAKWQTTADSDAQVDASQPVPETRPRDEKSASPTAMPVIVKGFEPKALLWYWRTYSAAVSE
eukprot:759438-Rhodomonas_salina.1